MGNSQDANQAQENTPQQEVGDSKLKSMHALYFKDEDWKIQKRVVGGSTHHAPTFSVLTYNVFFGPCADYIRYPTIISLILEKDADFVCLQEVTSSQNYC